MQTGHENSFLALDPASGEGINFPAASEGTASVRNEQSLGAEKEG